jgi:hypothetical protein
LRTLCTLSLSQVDFTDTIDIIMSSPGSGRTFVMFAKDGTPSACGQLAEKTEAYAASWSAGLPLTDPNGIVQSATDLQGEAIIHTTETGNGYGVLAIAGGFMHDLGCNTSVPEFEVEKCGLGIYSGDSCETEADQGTLFYSWRKVRYSPTRSPYTTATGVLYNESSWESPKGLPSSIVDAPAAVVGFYVPNVGGSVLGRPLIINDVTGQRAACGILTDAQPAAYDEVSERLKLQKVANVTVGITTYVVFAGLVLAVLAAIGAKLIQAQCDKCANARRAAARAKAARRPKMDEKPASPRNKSKEKPQPKADVVEAAAADPEAGAAPADAKWFESELRGGEVDAAGEAGTQHIGLGPGVAASHLRAPVQSNHAMQMQVEMYQRMLAAQAMGQASPGGQFPVAGFQPGAVLSPAGLAYQPAPSMQFQQWQQGHQQFTSPNALQPAPQTPMSPTYSGGVGAGGTLGASWLAPQPAAEPAAQPAAAQQPLYQFAPPQASYAESPNTPMLHPASESDDVLDFDLHDESDSQSRIPSPSTAARESTVLYTNPAAAPSIAL